MTVTPEQVPPSSNSNKHIPFSFNVLLSQHYAVQRKEAAVANPSDKEETNGPNKDSVSENISNNVIPSPSPSNDNANPSEDSKSTSKATKRVRARSGGGTPSSLVIKAEIPTTRYADLGGIERVIGEIREVVERPFRYPELYRHLGVEPPRGVLLYGPPGSGKSCLAMAIAGELHLPLLHVSSPELIAGMSGESEGRIRDLFERASGLAPCLLFLDEIDAITPKRETAQREMERRIVAQLLSCMDELARSGAMVMVLGATNRPDSLDPALRRAGRFDRELRLGIPGEEERMRILQVLCQRLRLGRTANLSHIARHTPGYVGADLKALTQEAASAAIRRIFNTLQEGEAQGEIRPSPSQLEQMAIEPEDFFDALSRIQPSAKREGFAVVPDTRWEDIGALSAVRDELRMAVIEPIRHPEKFAAVGLTAPAGVLLWGPPGCGKTLLAKAVANESHSNFISVKGPELLNKYVGESERAVRQVFERARHSAPCVVFFDELDALCPRRNEEADSATSRVVNQLLTEMDGLESRRQVFVLAATNRPDMIDPAMTRPGRLDKLLYVNLPNASERAEILRAISRRTPWASDVDLERVAGDVRCTGFSGADLAALIREASLAAIRASIDREEEATRKTILSNNPHDHDQDHDTQAILVGDPIDGNAILGRSTCMQVDPSPCPLQVSYQHLEAAFARVTPSVSPRELAKYEWLLRERTNK